jgi:hypothetical protein
VFGGLDIALNVHIAAASGGFQSEAELIALIPGLDECVADMLKAAKVLLHLSPE